MPNFCRIELLYTLVIMGGSMTFGMVMAYWSSAEKTMTEDLGFTGQMGNIMNALAPFGCIVGGPLISIFLNRVGRRTPLFVTGVICFICMLTLGFVQKSFKWLAFVMRAIVGICTGAFSAVCPLYITELAPTELRGAFGTLNQLGVSSGASLSYLSGVFFDWRIVTYISAAPSLLMCIFLYIVVPESPVIERKKDTDSESLYEKRFIRPIIVSLLLMFFQQFTGLAPILSSLQQTIAQSGSSIDPSIASFLVGCAGILGVFCCSPMVEKLGRRPAWHVSGIGQFIAILLLALNDAFSWSNILPVISLFFVNFLFSVGYGPVPWFFVPELFPDGVRSHATSMMTAANWIFSTITTYLWPVMRNEMGMTWGYLTFAFILIASIIFGFIFLPEPRGLEMGTIYDNQGKPSSPDSMYETHESPMETSLLATKQQSY